MISLDVKDIFTKETLADLFPPDKADNFFDALYGDSAEGAYDISLAFNKQEKDQLLFEFHLNQRPGKCLVCSLTYGLPTVFSRHPIIDLKGLADKISELLGKKRVCTGWKVEGTREINRQLHVVPISFQIS